jgi:CIC family chloride channel protein
VANHDGGVVTTHERRVWLATLRHMLATLRDQRRLVLDTLLLGVVGALSAQIFMFLLRLAQTVFLVWLAGFVPLGLPSEGGSPVQIIGPHGLWLIPVATTLGGLITGLLVYTFAPEAEGHGTDTAIKAFHRTAGLIRVRVPIIKTIASAITIGSGGAAGREGPTALISAGVGSVYATFTRRSEDERRLLMLIGMAAGLAAIFRSPIGTALFAIEVLYGGMEFEASGLLYTMLASVVAYAVNGLFVGYEPLFLVPKNLPTPGFADFGWYAVLGLAAGVMATLMPIAFYGIRDVFASFRIPPHVKPAIGALAFGLMAMFLPQLIGGGYGWIQQAIDGKLAPNLLLILAFAQILALSLIISSGGSGGVFAPTLFVGAMLGGFLAQLFHQPAAGMVVVGMAAVFGGAARVPIATLLMVTEMTGGYTLLVPAALAVMLSFLLQVTLSLPFKYPSLYEAQVATRADSPAHHIEQLEVVLRLLSERRFAVPASITHLDLRMLLNSGIPVDLPDSQRLVIGSLRPESPCVGQPVHACFNADGPGKVETVAVFRQGHTLLADDKLKLRAGDRLLCIASPAAWERLQTQLTSISPGQRYDPTVIAPLDADQ